MRKLLILLAMVILYPIASLLAQSIPNSSFEDWTTHNLPPELINWQSFNSIAGVATGSPTTIKDADAHSGKYSVKLVATQYMGNTIPGYLVYGDIVNQKGLPYTSRPTSFHISIKSDIPAGDSGSIIIGLHTTNIAYSGIFGGATIGIKGRHSTWKDTVITINYADPTGFVKPDSILVAFAYSNPAKGSYMQVDSFKLIGSGSIAQIPNNNFENWDSTVYEDANQWTSVNFLAVPAGFSPAITKSTDAYSGKYAMQIKTETGKLFGTLDTFGFVTVGTINPKGISGGIPAYNTRPASFSFYYKYTAGFKGDSGNVGILLRKNGKTLDSFGIILPPASTYTRHTFTIPSGAVPDTINIVFASYNYFGSRHYSAPVASNSVLLVDSLTFGTLNGIDDNMTDAQSLNVFPNPCKDAFYIQCYKKDSDPLDLAVYNILGQEVVKQKLSIGANDNSPHLVNPGQLCKGIYTYSVRNNQVSKTGRIIIE